VATGIGICIGTAPVSSNTSSSDTSSCTCTSTRWSCCRVLLRSFSLDD